MTSPPLPGPSQKEPTPPPPSPSALALLSLSQDITALISLSLEATASLVHDWYRSVTDTIGFGALVRYSPPNKSSQAKSTLRGESGRGLAVVVVGASEATGQSLTLHLAKSGYTVFPFLPLPSPSSPPTSSALSTLLLAWSGMQKRLRARLPNHSGAVVPVITESENIWEEPTPAGLVGKARGKFGHAGETVRAYCRENSLSLVAVVCAARGPKRIKTQDHPTSPYKIQQAELLPSDVTTLTTYLDPNVDSRLTPRLSPVRLLPSSSLTMTDEQTLLSLYQTNILDPISVIRELSDLLAASGAQETGRGRVIFVGGESCGEPWNAGVNDDASDLLLTQAGLGDNVLGAMKMIKLARSQAAKLLREELGGVGIEVCEVVVGPMSPRIGIKRNHRLSSDDAVETSGERKRIANDSRDNNAINDGYLSEGGLHSVMTKEAVLAQRLAFLSRIWAVDDALLYSAVRRAIEDRYPRYRHHAGISPLLASIAEVTPGSGLVKMFGRWVLGRLLTPRRG